MFVKEGPIKRMFKEAWKGVGLRIANDKDGLLFTGRSWYMYVFREYFPKELLGAVISMTGEIPVPSMQVLYNKEEAQTELYMADTSYAVYKRALEAEAEDNAAERTDIIILDIHEWPYRIYTDSMAQVYAVPERIAEMIEPGICEPNEDYHGCFALKDGWLYWVSDYMAFGFASHMANDEVRGRAMKLKEAGIV